MMQNLKRTWLVNSKLTRGIWWILTRALQNLKNLHFNGLLLTKVCNVWAKKCPAELFLIALKIDSKFEGTLTCAFRNDMRNLAKFELQSKFESLKIWTFIGSFYPKQKTYELKIFRGVMCHDNEQWFKIWRGTDLSVQKWNEEFNKFWPEHSKYQKFAL